MTPATTPLEALMTLPRPPQQEHQQEITLLRVLLSCLARCSRKDDDSPRSPIIEHSQRLPRPRQYIDNGIDVNRSGYNFCPPFGYTEGLSPDKKCEKHTPIKIVDTHGTYTRLNHQQKHSKETPYLPTPCYKTLQYARDVHEGAVYLHAQAMSKYPEALIEKPQYLGCVSMMCRLWLMSDVEVLQNHVGSCAHWAELQQIRCGDMTQLPQSIKVLSEYLVSDEGITTSLKSYPPHLKLSSGWHCSRSTSHFGMK